MAESSQNGGSVPCSDRYPAIEDYAFLSDSQTSALVGPDGSIEWMCVPRFDSPSIFARILDREKGGAFELEIEGAGEPERSYAVGTFVLESKYTTPTGTVLVSDFLSLEAEGEHGRGEVKPHNVLVRLITCNDGSVRVRVRVDTKPNYGADTPEWNGAGTLYKADVPDTTLWMTSDQDLSVKGGEICSEIELGVGESAAYGLRYRESAIRHMDSEIAFELMETTKRSWQEWANRCEYHGTVEIELVIRSALVIKGLFYQESGALLAAPTTSLPEQLGGERNWDYRFSWLRDSTLMLLALFRLGYEEEGTRYIDFLMREWNKCGCDLQLMLGIGGELDLPESKIDHLEGYACSSPVRIGNGAAEQLQLDTYGEVLDAAYVFHRQTGKLAVAHWPFLSDLVDYTSSMWKEPDDGIWETRCERRHYTHSKVMAWVCLDRGIRLALELGIDTGQVERWRNTADEIHESVCEHGYDKEIKSFVQFYGSKALDASALRFSLVGFLPGDDPRIISTIDRIEEELSAGNGLLYRYRLDRTDDGLAGDEGAFAICSFWLVSAQVLAGRKARARELFHRLARYASPLGLYSEEIHPDGRMLGNYPQAFTHLALIQAAVNLSFADDREALHAWAARR